MSSSTRREKEAKGKGKNTKENPELINSTNKIAHTFHVLIDDGRGFQGVGVGEQIFMQTLQFREPNFTATWWLAAAARSNWLVVALTTCAIAATAAASKLTTAKAPVPRASQLFSDLLFYLRLPRPQKHAQKVFNSPQQIHAHDKQAHRILVLPFK